MLVQRRPSPVPVVAGLAAGLALGGTATLLEPTLYRAEATRVRFSAGAGLCGPFAITVLVLFTEVLPAFRDTAEPT